MFICGNDEAAKAQAAALCKDLGWPTIDFGGIERSRELESLCILWCMLRLQDQHLGPCLCHAEEIRWPSRSRPSRQSVHFDATPSQIYELLMISKKHAAFSGEPAKISTKVGGNFTAYGDYIEGKNIELFKGKKIVQSWRTSEWPKGHYSRATWTFRLPAEGGCTMDFISRRAYALEHFVWLSARAGKSIIGI